MRFYSVGAGTQKETGENEGVAINHDSQFPIIKEGEELTLNIMAPGVGMAEWEDMPTLQDYQEKQGIKLTYTTPLLLTLVPSWT